MREGNGGASDGPPRPPSVCDGTAAGRPAAPGGRGGGPTGQRVESTGPECAREGRGAPSCCLCPGFGYFVSSDTRWQPAVSRVIPTPARPEPACYQQSTLDQAPGALRLQGRHRTLGHPPGGGPRPGRWAGPRGSPLLLLLQGERGQGGGSRHSGHPPSPAQTLKRVGLGPVKQILPLTPTPGSPSGEKAAVTFVCVVLCRLPSLLLPDPSSDLAGGDAAVP